jgi:signal transduction histidine kinase
VRAEIHRLDQAVDALLRFMRPEKMETRELRLNDLLNSIGSHVAQSNIKVYYHLDQNLPPVMADKGLLEEAIRALVQNAVQAMPDGGNLTLGSALSLDGCIEITVADQGPGIPPEDLDHIFNLYFTTKEGGSGVGLSLAMRAVDLHQGTINVASRVGSGTTFTIRLPIGHDAAALPSAAAQV